MRVVIVVVVVLLGCVGGGCIDSNSVRCPNGELCPSGTACDIEHGICVDPDQLTACIDLEQAADCTFDATDGKCTEGVCLVPSCGNTVLDIGEACEDQNNADRDGCAADCRSNETCGNGVADLPVGEACDDGNGFNNDGCADDCTLERAQWVDGSQVAPPGRRMATMAYDPNRDAIILFGGASDGEASLADTWVWRGEWSQPPPLLATTPVIRGVAAYHHELGRVVVHGGRTSAGATEGGVLAWDGTKWVRGPDGPRLSAHAGAYDARRKRLVVFGGNTEGPASDKTWEFDGTTWTEVVPATTRPTPRVNSVMTYDPEHGVVLLYGGFDLAQNARSTELWAFDGVDWSLRSTGGPVARDGVMFAYHVPSHAAILFGGQIGTDSAAETWSVTGAVPAVWTNLTPSLTSTPSARAFGAMVADGSGRLVLFGGREGSLSYPADTWIFDGDWRQTEIPFQRTYGGAAMDVDRRTLVVFGGAADATLERSEDGWKELATIGGVTAPAAYDAPGLVYDEKNRVTVAFGGIDGGGTPTNETWLWNGSGTWTKAPSVGAFTPPPTRKGQLVYDSANERVLLFAPHTLIPVNNPSFGAQTTALWSWDGTEWSPLQPPHTPQPRLYAIVGYDRIRNQLVMFGGNNGEAAGPVEYDDTWVFDGVDWQEVVPPAGTPRPPSNQAGSGTLGQSVMVWNPARQRLTMLDRNVSAWEWLGTHWEQVQTPVRPPQREAANLVPSFDGHGITYMFGVREAENAGHAPWELRWSGSGATESCERAVDVDGDTRMGCADLDCWNRCSPHCPPGTSCPADAPVCGDMTCDPNEDCYSCDDCACSPVCGDFVCSAGESACPGDCP